MPRTSRSGKTAVGQDRAGQDPGQDRAPHEGASHLRAAARALPMLGPPAHGERAALAALLTQLDALTRAVHRLRTAQDRQAQAAAAATAALLLGRAVDLLPKPDPPSVLALTMPSVAPLPRGLRAR